MILNDTGSRKSWKFLSDQIEEIVVGAKELNSEFIKRGLKKMIPDYNPKTEIHSDEYPEDMGQYPIRGEAQGKITGIWYGIIVKPAAAGFFIVYY